MYLGKVHKLVTVQLTLFAGMAYAFGQLDWVRVGSSAITWGIALASLGALSLVVGFVCGLRCLGITATSVVGIKALKTLVTDGKIAKIRPDELYGDLTQNLADGILEERARNEQRRPWNRCLNHSTLLGFLFVAAFVAFAIVGKLVTPDDQETPLGESTMDNSDQPHDSQQPEPTSQDTQEDSPGGQVDSDRPTAVEPSETSDRDVGATRPSLGNLDKKG